MHDFASPEAALRHRAGGAGGGAGAAAAAGAGRRGLLFGPRGGGMHERRAAPGGDAAGGVVRAARLRSARPVALCQTMIGPPGRRSCPPPSSGCSRCAAAPTRIAARFAIDAARGRDGRRGDAARRGARHSPPSGSASICAPPSPPPPALGLPATPGGAGRAAGGASRRRRPGARARAAGRGAGRARPGRRGAPRREAGPMRMLDGGRAAGGRRRRRWTRCRRPTTRRCWPRWPRSGAALCRPARTCRCAGPRPARWRAAGGAGAARPAGRALRRNPRRPPPCCAMAPSRRRGHWIASGALPDGTGFAAVETPRGRMHHLVARRRAGPGGASAPCWRRPNGISIPTVRFVHALPGLRVGSGGAAAARIRWLVGLFDPCVGCTLDLRGDRAMHEMALTESVIGIVEEEARRQNFARVRAVVLEIGALACAEPDVHAVLLRRGQPRHPGRGGAARHRACARRRLVLRLRARRWRSTERFCPVPGLRRLAGADDRAATSCGCAKWRSSDVHGVRLRRGPRRRPRARHDAHDHGHDHDHAGITTTGMHDHGHHDHAHAAPGTHDYGAGLAGVHVPGLSAERIVRIERDILGKNAAFARANRARLAGAAFSRSTSSPAPARARPRCWCAPSRRWRRATPSR